MSKYDLEKRVGDKVLAVMRKEAQEISINRQERAMSALRFDILGRFHRESSLFLQHPTADELSKYRERPPRLPGRSSPTDRSSLESRGLRRRERADLQLDFDPFWQPPTIVAAVDNLDGLDDHSSVADLTASLVDAPLAGHLVPPMHATPLGPPQHSGEALSYELLSQADTAKHAHIRASERLLRPSSAEPPRVASKTTTPAKPSRQSNVTRRRASSAAPSDAKPIAAIDSRKSITR